MLDILFLTPPGIFICKASLLSVAEILWRVQVSLSGMCTAMPCQASSVLAESANVQAGQEVDPTLVFLPLVWWSDLYFVVQPAGPRWELLASDSPGLASCEGAVSLLLLGYLVPLFSLIFNIPFFFAWVGCFNIQGCVMCVITPSRAVPVAQPPAHLHVLQHRHHRCYFLPPYIFSISSW